MLPTVEESRGYDFQDPDNAAKWRGLFINSLRKLLEQAHPSLRVEESALQYVESLCLRLLSMLTAPPSPLTVQDVEDRVARTFPKPIDQWTLTDARENAAQKKRKPVLPIDKIHHMLHKEVLLYKLDIAVASYITNILEFISLDILKLTGNFVKKISQKSGCDTVTCRDIKTAMCADKVLMDMFYQDPDLTASSAASKDAAGKNGAITYGELVRDLLTDEKQFLRDLNLIIRVFKDEIERILDNDARAVSLIFGNIVDIYELTVTLLGNLEDALEVSQDSASPYIGSCIEELAEVEEFRAYVRYANIVTRRESREALRKVLDDPLLSERLDTAGHGFRLACKYYLPRLLLAPLAHVFLLHTYVLALRRHAPTHVDRESFKQVECNLDPIKKLLIKALGNGPKLEATLRMATRARRQLAIEKCNEMAKIVENWDLRDIGQCCNEFIREDTLSKIGPGKRVAERRAFLFDGLLLLCKPITGLPPPKQPAKDKEKKEAEIANKDKDSKDPKEPEKPEKNIQLKMKEKLHIRKLDVVDRQDTDDAKHLVELVPRVGAPVLLACASAVDKRDWMCDLIMLNTKPMLDRALDSILLDLEKKHPLRLPSPEVYRFAEPDSPANMVLEERGNNTTPLIKGATLLKLVERLTYHIYADLNLVRTFLTTYRSFCTAPQLLTLLIERFNIPPPPSPHHTEESIENIATSDAEKLSKNSMREDWKRYRKEFEQPVKFRVINVLRHWVDQHWYDFERDPELLQRAKTFLLAVDGKPMRKWVLSVLKIIDRKSQCLDEGVCHVFSHSAPAVIRHLAPPAPAWHPLALHPLELARQLTLCHFSLYRQVKPSELVGAVWTKKDKEKTSPNLLKIIKHTTNLTRWMEKWIVESANLEERVAVCCRFLELCVALRDLNNLNAVLAVVAAFGSAAVHRLKGTLQLVPPRLHRALEEFRELNSDHFRRYQERLRSINPPCVPFFGMYLTNILHIEEGNADYLPNSELINFSKRRKVAEITGEIQQYQNQPYCLSVEPATMAFLESLDPFPGMDDNEITNYLYAKSLEIEPRPPAKQMPKIPRMYPELSLKQVKVSRRAHHDHHSTSSNDDTLSVSQLSPTGSSAWDGTSLSSLSIMSHDDRSSLVSPRLERCSSSSFSLFDKGLALFDKTKSSTLSSRSSISLRDEPPSPRERHSPRHERNGSGERRAALSPRGAIVDAALFYASAEPPRAPSAERVPPLLPRHSVSHPASPPPLAPRRAVSPHDNTAPDERPPLAPRKPASPDTPAPEPPDRPLPSPKHHDLSRAPAMSPARSPHHPPSSPQVIGDRPAPAPPAFSFPQRAPPPSPPAPPLTPHPPAPLPASSSCGTPPPLPPRRRRDPAAPHTPLHQFGLGAAGSVPPPLPPRPAPAPELLRPAHSTILQRRHLNNTTSITSSEAPKLPPKPPPPALAPRT